MHTPRTGTVTRTVTAAAPTATPLARSARGGDTAGREVGTTVEDVREDAASRAGQEVRVSADADEVPGPTASTIARAEDQVGADLDDAPFERWVGQPHLAAESIDTSVPSGR